MRKLFLLIVMVSYTTLSFAQKDVTEFLGIPVDGSKSSMIQKLKAKGFTYQNYEGTDILKGQFNGIKSHIYIATNNNKVCRIMICDESSMDEGSIKIRYNRLCEQFKNNKKYVSFDNYIIPKEEDISFEMTVHNKKYDAIFYQLPKNIDTLSLQNKIKEDLLSKYTQEQLENPTEEITNDILHYTISVLTDLVIMKPVWFRIEELYGQYYISLFYDNEYNRANGEDL